MSDDCPGCRRKRFQLGRVPRVVALTPSLTARVPAAFLQGTDHGRVRLDFVVSVESYPHGRYGRAHVVCGCEAPGHRMLGGGITVLYGRNGQKLLDHVEEHLDELSRNVLVALYPGTPLEGYALPALHTMLEEAGKRYTVARFDGWPIIQCDGLADEPFSYVRGAPVGAPPATPGITTFSVLSQ